MTGVHYEKGNTESINGCFLRIEMETRDNNQDVYKRQVQTRPLMLSDPRSFVNFKERRLLSARGRLEKYRT